MLATNEDAKLSILAALQATTQGWYALVQNEDGTYTAGGNLSLGVIQAAKGDLAETETKVRASDSAAFEESINQQRVTMQGLLGATFVEAEFEKAANEMRREYGFPEVGNIDEERAPEHIINLTLSLLGEDKRNEAGVDEFLANFSSFAANLPDSVKNANPEAFHKKNAQMKKQLMERINSL